MSRTSRIMEGLGRLQDEGIIVAYQRADTNEAHWIIATSAPPGTYLNYYTSREAEAFMAGAEAVKQRQRPL